MASTSTPADRPEGESANTSQETVPSPSTSVISSSPCLCSPCFDWVSSLIGWRSVHSNSMASTSTPDLPPENEVRGAFHEIAPSASSSASALIQKPRYDVFINHRGPDVKHTLASSIYNILDNMKVTAFLDSEELEYCDFLPTTLEAAMRGASLHIAIFSENYAKSSWCLAELSFMLKTGAKIFPVFYYVEPTDLRYVDRRNGMYAKTFKEHEMKGRYSSEKLQEWKKALYDVSFYTGEIIKNNEDEKRLLKNIVNCVCKVINDIPLVVAKYPVGLKEIIQDFEMSTLQSFEGDQGVQIVGIWGMGGSGKTTLVKELYNKISSSMERSSFVSDVRDAGAKGVLHNKQIKLLTDLGVKGAAFDNIEDGMKILSNYLRSVRVLIVLDDVDHVEQLDALLPKKDGLERGSLVIVTTRGYDVLKSWGISSVYKMKPLNYSQAEQLFCWHAFLQSFPKDGFEKFVKKFLVASQGLPLSLKVFAGQLYGESRKEYWNSFLHNISRILSDDIKDKLKVSYDALNYEEKQMFLDTACFFIGEESSLAIEVWNGLGWSGLYSWEKLLNKCLAELDDDNHIKMHDHLRDMGREIANQQSPYRIWFPQQIINTENREEKRIGIRGIMTTSTEILWINVKQGGKPFPLMDDITGEADEFCVCCLQGEIMVNTNGGIWSLAPFSLGLKYFVIRGDYFNQAIGEVSRELVWLRWFQIGQRNLPSWLSLKKLRILELYEGNRGENYLEELWSETEGAAPEQLRELVVSYCYKFRGFPNSIGRLKNLKKIVIIYGFNVRSLPEEFCLLQSLEHLVFYYCSMLSSLPTNFGNLRNLRLLCMSRCKELRKLPVSFKNLMLLEYVNLGGCSQLTFTSEDLNILQNMTKLEFLRLSGCKQLEELPRHITSQASLRELYLQDTSLRELPVNIGQLSKLREMMIESVFLTSLPISLGDLSSLTNLSIHGCHQLECLPDSVGRLNLLKKLEIKDLGVKFLPKSVRQLNNLQTLQISNCPISELDFGVGSLPFALSNLKRIDLQETLVCRISISEDFCPHLETLTVENNHHLKEIEALPTMLKSLKLTKCEMLKNIPSFTQFTSLREFVPRLETLTLEYNHHLQEIEALPTTLKSLKLKECEMLKRIPSFAQFSSLREFVLESCYQIEKIEGLENCTRLETLRVDACLEDPGIESMQQIEKLRVVKIRANKGSAIKRCIQTIQKWPDEIEICTRAVPVASSLVDSIFSPNLIVVDSLSKQKIQSNPKLVQKRSSNGDAILLCFIINCVSSQMTLTIHGLEPRRFEVSEYLTKVEKGRWAWAGIFTQRSKSIWLPAEEFWIEGSGGDCEEEDEVEKGLVVRGEEQRLVEAFQSLLPILQS